MLFGLKRGPQRRAAVAVELDQILQTPPKSCKGDRLDVILCTMVCGMSTVIGIALCYILCRIQRSMAHFWSARECVLSAGQLGNRHNASQLMGCNVLLQDVHKRLLG
mmetsp:Transcript_467/g.1118  ORF Transcript_467/g.1118 Transcript_467/m.1118 type:complete len:107 (-) Transcript_467:635-955(-)